jgi:hypothetical protein
MWTWRTKVRATNCFPNRVLLSNNSNDGYTMHIWKWSWAGGMICNFKVVITSSIIPDCLPHGIQKMIPAWLTHNKSKAEPLHNNCRHRENDDLQAATQISELTVVLQRMVLRKEDLPKGTWSVAFHHTRVVVAIAAALKSGHAFGYV